MQPEIMRDLGQWLKQKPYQAAVLGLAGIFSIIGVLSAFSLGLHVLQESEHEQVVSNYGLPRPKMSGASQDFPMEAAYRTSGMARLASPEKPALASDRQIVRTARLEVVVGKYETAYETLLKMADETGAEIISSQSFNLDNKKTSGIVTLAIIPEKLETLTHQITRLGVVKQRQATSSDVTESYIDLETRLKGAKNLRERLTGLLKTRTGKLEEVLAVEKELARIQEDIERLEAQFRYLSAQIQRARLEVQIFERYHSLISADLNVVLTIRNALNRAWNAFLKVLAAGVIAGGYVAGMIFLVGLFLGGYGGMKKIRDLWRKRTVSGTRRPDL